MSGSNGHQDHYLKTELYALIQSDPTIFEFLQAGSLDGIWYWDLVDTDQEWLSDRFKSVFGFAPDEMDHSPAWWQANIYPEDLALALENFAAHAADPAHPYDQVVRYRHRDGSTVWVRCRGLAIRDDEGKPIRMLGAHTDVTALKKTEEELRNTNELLAKRNSMLEDFASVAAHDLSSPLRQLAVFCEMLKEDLAEGRSAEALASLDVIEQRVDHTRRLVKTLLDFSVTGLNVDMQSKVDIEPCIKNAIQSVSDTGPMFELHINDPRPVSGETDLLERVFVNLLSNAARYAGSEATIKIEGRALSDGKYRVCLTDDGPGVPDGLEERVFEPFARAAPDDGKRAGFGIGLALCRRIMESHGGTIHIDPSYRAGARFVLDFT